MAAVDSFCDKKLENSIGILCGSFGCVVKVEDTATKQYYAGKISVGQVDSVSKLENESTVLK